MTPVFLYGTLRYAPLLSLVLGREAELIPATLADHQVVWAAGESYPLIRKGGDRLHGALIEATEDDLARMDFYEGAFAYELVAAEVQTDAGVRTAQVYWPPETGVQPGDPWHLEDWAAKWGDLTLLAAAEVMAAFGREDPLAVGRRFGIIRARAQAALNTRAWQRPRTVGRAMGQAAAELVDRRPEYLGFFTLETLSVRHDRLGDGPPHGGRPACVPGRRSGDRAAL